MKFPSFHQLIKNFQSNNMKRYFKKLFAKPADPVDLLPPIAMELILGHLRGNQMLQLSLVSKKWYKFIGNSPVCMDKIKIHITELFWSYKRVFTNADLLRVFDHGRKYKHLSVACLSTHNIKMQQFSTEHKLLMALFQWKSVHLCHHSFDNEMEFINFLGLMEPTVEEIDLRSVKIKKLLGVAPTNFEFPHLRVLRCSNVANFVYFEPFVNVRKLKEFAVATEQFLPSYKDHSEEIKDRVRGIKQILLKNPNIKFLEIFLEQKDFDCMFFDSRFLANIKFELRILILGRFKKVIKDKANYFPIKNFGKFLRLHVTSLIELQLPEWLGDEITEIIVNEMQILKSLTMNQTDEYNNEISFANANLLMNEKIERLDIWTRSVRLTEIVTKMLPILPNLKQLTTRIIDQKVLNVIAEKNPLLEFIESDFFIATVPPPNALENLKGLIIYIKSNDNLRQLLEAKEELSNFEKVFLMSAKGLKRKWDLNCSS